MVSGFIFAFKLYMENHDAPCIDWIEHMVKRLTDSEIIHVEMIPVLGGEYTAHRREDGHVVMAEGSKLVVSDKAHTAYVGSGYQEHSSETCLRDASFHHIFVPTWEEDMLEGISFLKMQQGKRYNYLALPFTVMMPQSYKLRKIEALEDSLSSPKVFCSQMGLMLCYLSRILTPRENNSPVFFDPLFCTPADLYHLIMQEGNGHAMHCNPRQLTSSGGS